MNKALLTLAAVALASSVYAADGTITFSNSEIAKAAPATGTYDAPIMRAGGTVGAGAGYTAGLFLASNLNTPLATITFFGATGFFVGSDVTVTGTAPGSTPALTIRAWDTAAGSFANAVAQGKQRGEQTFTPQPLGGTNPNPPPPAFFTPGLTGFTGFTMVVPEPSTYALGIAGLGALAMMRRRK